MILEMLDRLTGRGWFFIGVVLAGILFLVVGCFIGGCGTARGVITGLESTGSGIVQDLRGAVDGIDSADAVDGGGE